MLISPEKYQTKPNNIKYKLAQICGSISAHVRCINAIDCNEQGLLASVGDDCFVRIWKLTGNPENLQVRSLIDFTIEMKSRDDSCMEYSR